MKYFKNLSKLLLIVILIFNGVNAQTNSNPCKDPWKDIDWYKVIGNEIFDFKQLVVWHRCPSLYTEGGKCVSGMTLPSENFKDAKTVPKWAPTGNWRLPTIGEIDRIVAKKCNYLFPAEIIEIPPVPLWTSSIFRGSYLKTNDSGDVFLDTKDEIAWTIYNRDFDTKEIIIYKSEAIKNLNKISLDESIEINKTKTLKLVKTEIFFEDELSRVQLDNRCAGDINKLIVTLNCLTTEGAQNTNKNKLECLGKKRNTYICISETIEATNPKLVGNTTRVDIEFKENTFKMTAYPNNRGGTLMPYKIETNFIVGR